MILALCMILGCLPAIVMAEEPADAVVIRAGEEKLLEVLAKDEEYFQYKDVLLSFTPEESGTYVLYRTSDNIHGIGDLSNDEYGMLRNQFYAQAGTTYYFEVHVSWYDAPSAIASVMVEKAVPMESMRTDYEHRVIYTHENITNDFMLNVSPVNALIPEMTIVSDNPAIVTADCREDYIDVQALKAGDAVLTITAGAFTCKIGVNVPGQEYLTLNEPVTVPVPAGEDCEKVFYFDPPAEGGDFVAILTGGNGLTNTYLRANDQSGVISGNRAEFTYFDESWYVDGHQDAAISVDLRNRGLATEFQLTVMESAPLTGMAFEKSNYTFYLEHEYLASMNYVCYPINGQTGEVTWTSSNPEVLDFDYWGSLNLNGAGQTTITVTAENGMSASCTVTVKDPEFGFSSMIPSGELKVNQPESFVSSEYYAEIAYLFTPSTSGSYYIHASNEGSEKVGIDIGIPDCIGLRHAYGDVTYYMEAGTTYMIVFSPFCYEETRTIVGIDSCVPATGLEIITGYDTDTLETEYFEGDYAYLDVDFLPANGALENVTWTVDNGSIVRFYDPSSFDTGESDSACLLELTGPGTVTVTATSESGLTDSVTLTVKPVPVLTLDNPVPIALSRNRTPVKFVPEVSGWYAFMADLGYDPGLSCNIYSPTEGHITTEYQEYYTIAYLEGGKEYTISYALGYEPEEPIFCSAVVEQMVAATSLEVYTRDSSHGYVGSDAYLRTRFNPEFSIQENVTWSIDNTEVASLFHSDWENTFVHFDAPGTVTVTATSESGLTDSITFTVSEIDKLVLNNPVPTTLSKQYSKIFSFIPTQTGWYSFSAGSDVGGDVDWSIYEADTHNMPDSTGGYDYISVLLEAGIEYHVALSLYEYYPEDTVSCNVLVQKMPYAESIEISLDHGIRPFCPGDFLAIYATLNPQNAAPEAIMWNVVSGASLVELESWGDGCYLTLKAPGTVIIQASTASGVASTTSFTIVEMPTMPVDSMVSLSLDGENPARFKFTAPQSGWYAFMNDCKIPDMVHTMVFGNSDSSTAIGPANLPTGTYGEGYPSCYLEAGEEYEVRFYGNGIVNCKAYVEKLEDPTSFTLTSHISSITLLESEWGYTPELAVLLKGAEGTFTWADGSTTQWSFDKEGYRHSYLTLSQEPRPIPNEDGSFTLELCWGNVSDSFDFSINTKVLESIELVNPEDIYLIENAEGYYETDYNGNPYWEYSTWILSYRVKLKLTFADGTSEIIGGNDVKYGHTVYLGSNQGVEPWTIGGNNILYITFGDTQIEFNVPIRKNPVSGFSATCPGNITVGDPTFGITTDEGYIFQPNDYSFLNGTVFTVTYNDGTPPTSRTFEELLEAEGMLNGFSVMLDFADVPEFIRPGDTMTVNIGYLGAENTVTVNFVAPKTILNGDDSQWVTESETGAPIRVDADPEDLVEVYVDGELVDPKNYTVTRGSTIITFTPEFLSTLEIGTHDVSIAFTDARAITTLTITDEPTLPGDLNGDGSVDDTDVELLLWHYLFGDVYPISGNGDFNGDGSIDDLDVETLLWHYLFGTPLS